LEQHLSKANSHSASQAILRRLWNPKYHYRVHESQPVPRHCKTFRKELIFYDEDVIGMLFV